MNNPVKLREALAYFTGSETFYKHWLRRMIYTEGVQHFAEHAGGGAYWFLDIVATEILPLQRKEEFISIIMLVTGSTATIQADDGNDHIFWSKPIYYTDCPEGEWKFYLVNNTLMLPSEY